MSKRSLASRGPPSKTLELLVFKLAVRDKFMDNLLLVSSK